MALKPTIYKFKISLSDLNRDNFDVLNLTVAKHPSETSERMMVRVLAYCLHSQEFLVFTKGLSAVDEPDLWLRTLDDQIKLWIDVGEPGFDRVKKATRISEKVMVYCFNSKSNVWWEQRKADLSKLNVNIIKIDWPSIQIFAQMLQRTMDISVTISGDSAYFATNMGACEVVWENLQIVEC